MRRIRPKHFVIFLAILAGAEGTLFVLARSTDWDSGHVLVVALTEGVVLALMALLVLSVLWRGWQVSSRRYRIVAAITCAVLATIGTVIPRHKQVSSYSPVSIENVPEAAPCIAELLESSKAPNDVVLGDIIVLGPERRIAEYEFGFPFCTGRLWDIGQWNLRALMGTREDRSTWQRRTWIAPEVPWCAVRHCTPIFRGPERRDLWIDWSNAGFVALLWLVITALILLGALPVTSQVVHRWRFPPGHCQKCGYDLRGLPEPRCPECGRAFDPAEVGALSPLDG